MMLQRFGWPWTKSSLLDGKGSSPGSRPLPAMFPSDIALLIGGPILTAILLFEANREHKIHVERRGLFRFPCALLFTTVACLGTSALYAKVNPYVGYYSTYPLLNGWDIRNSLGHLFLPWSGLLLHVFTWIRRVICYFSWSSTYTTNAASNDSVSLLFKPEHLSSYWPSLSAVFMANSFFYGGLSLLLTSKVWSSRVHFSTPRSFTYLPLSGFLLCSSKPFARSHYQEQLDCQKMTKTILSIIMKAARQRLARNYFKCARQFAPGI